jgi:phenylacetate-coenzyme A ligase PaaK-like adenylate-forming protein
MRPSLRTRILDGLLNRQVHDCFRLDARTLAGIHEQLSAFRPDYLICYASALALLAGHLRDHGQHARYGRRGIITGAEKLEPEQRRLIESVFDGPLCESYGSRECGTMAMQRPGERHFRVAGASVLLEPYGAAASAAGREVLVTLLHSRGMPLLRYRIGDTARFGASEAGGPSETIEEITGRVLDQIRLPGGGLVHGTEFPHFFKDFDILEFQVVQEPSGAVAVSLVGGAELRRAHLARIEEVLRRNLVDLPLSVSIVPAIERTAAGKRRPVICKMSAGA